MDKFDIYRIDGHALKIFLKVLESQSVTEAAYHFGLNQSTVSHTLDKLRNSVGQNLFERAGRGITPTLTAQELAPLAKEILTQLESMTLFGHFDPSTDQQDITIAANVTELLPELKRVHTRLRRTLPNRHIRFLELGARENLEPMLDSGSADVAVSIRSENLSPLLDYQNLTQDTLRIFYDPSMRGPVLTLDDYFAAEHALLDFGGARKTTVSQSIKSYDRTRNIVLGASDVYALANLIAGTQLITSLQSHLAAGAFTNLAHRPAPFPSSEIHFDLIWHRRHANAPRNLWLRNIIVEELSTLG